MGEFIKYKGFELAFSWGGWSVKYLVAFYLCLPLLAYFILPFFTAKRTLSGNRKSIAIIVLGDLGHSPRMCYHSLSFSKLNYYVSLCGYLQSEPSDEILEDVNIDIKAIPMVENHGLPFLLFAIEKICMQVVSLFSLLFELRGIDYIMIQNPPSMPLLLISIIFVKLFSRNTKIIIDWHNLNYSILNLKYNNENHPLVRFLKLYEMILGRFAFYNLTVTKRMKRFLVSDFGMNSKKSPHYMIDQHLRSSHCKNLKPLKWTFSTHILSSKTLPASTSTRFWSAPLHSPQMRISIFCWMP